jgi:tubulin delta
MSVIVIQIGQCGNQVGQEFYTTLVGSLVRPVVASKVASDDVQMDSQTRLSLWKLRDTFFRTDTSSKSGSKRQLIARAIIVDTEAKVIAQMLSVNDSMSAWRYDERNAYFQKAGSANNWACG